MRCSIAAVRKSRATPDIPGADLGGVHPAMNYLVQQNKRVAGENIDNRRLAVRTDPGRRQACRRCRRRRYRIRLRRHGVPAGRCEGDPARHPPAAAGKGRQACRVALLGDQDAHLLFAGRRRIQREFQVATLEFIGENGMSDACEMLRGDEIAASRSQAASSSSRPIWCLHRHRLLRVAFTDDAC
jgi:hypothetical protein